MTDQTKTWECEHSDHADCGDDNCGCACHETQPETAELPTEELARLRVCEQLLKDWIDLYSGVQTAQPHVIFQLFGVTCEALRIDPMEFLKRGLLKKGD